ncbi:hypothetical protein [Pelagibaculum spongiae]|uniref:Uncharacterized protein n=1 Tax=Pelagibaculum spongiae TaxID=2080658 RepID=A0A2V1H051_9GAMM|nr:hypothetical protein [Pelagibaculum spongiae]PVZ71843.1 hypothetical protein DC094_02115 [Pelagibaculum spongiae]
MKAINIVTLIALACGSAQAAPEYSLNMLSRTFSMDVLERNDSNSSFISKHPDDVPYINASFTNKYSHYRAQAFHLFGKAKINPFLTLESNAYLVGKLHLNLDDPDGDDSLYVLKNNKNSFGRISGALEITPNSNSKIRYGYMPLDLELLNSGDIKTAPLIFAATSLQYQTDLFKLDLTKASRSSASNDQNYESFAKLETGVGIVRKAPIYVAQADFSNGQLSGLASFARQKGIKYYRMAQLEFQTRLSNQLSIEAGVQYRERKEIENSGTQYENNHIGLRMGGSYNQFRSGLAFSYTNDKSDLEMSTRWRNQQGQSCQSCGFYVAGYNDNSLFHHAGEKAIKWNLGANLDQLQQGLSIDSYLIYGDDLHKQLRKTMDMYLHRQREFGLKISQQFGSNGAELSLQHSRNKQTQKSRFIDSDPDYGGTGTSGSVRTSYQTRITLNYPINII